MAIRAWRSLLYTPGSNARALEKASCLKADGLILDLEDAVGPTLKEKARKNVVSAAFRKTSSTISIRMNALDSKWGLDDLKEICKCPVTAVVAPKVNSPETVLEIANLMKSFGARDEMEIWAMIETPKGVLEAHNIAQAHSRLTALVMGTSDLTNELHCATTIDRLPLLLSLQSVVLAAKSAGIAAIDGVHLDLNDMDGFKDACIQGKSFGFDGKSLIHPKTLEICNQIFRPSQDQLIEAKRILQAWKESGDSGLVVLDGKLIENLHVAQAQRIIELDQLVH